MTTRQIRLRRLALIIDVIATATAIIAGVAVLRTYSTPAMIIVILSMMIAILCTLVLLHFAL